MDLDQQRTGCALDCRVASTVAMHTAPFSKIKRMEAQDLESDPHTLLREVCLEDEDWLQLIAACAVFGPVHIMGHITRLDPWSVAHRVVSVKWHSPERDPTVFVQVEDMQGLWDFAPTLFERVDMRFVINNRTGMPCLVTQPMSM